MSTTFTSLQRSYVRYNALDTKELYEALGWDDVPDKPEWRNTCAVRMHLALIESGISVPGRFAVLKGPHQGQRIEVSQMRLAEKIEQSGRFGSALRVTHREFVADRKILWHKTGIISFQRIVRYAGGHIDLLDSRSDWNCLRTCYLTSSEQMWFWPVR